MNYFPIFMDLRDQAVLVVGAGSVAERKIRLLLKAHARVQVVAQELNDAVHRWTRDGNVQWLAKEYSRQHLAGARLVYAASGDAELNLLVHAHAEDQGIPINVVDDKQHCRFITPAIIDREPLQIAISSSGTSPVLARRLRSWIERLLPLGIGKVAQAAGQLRNAAAAMPLSQRRQFWDQLLNWPAIMRWSEQAASRIEFDMRRSLRSPTDQSSKGRVYLVGAGPGRADLLTVRASALLGQADVILHDRLVHADILDMARRDADFIDVGKRAGNHHEMQHHIHELLVEHARAGKQVVRLKGGDPFVFGRGGEELEALREAGIDYEVVPGVTAASACAAYAGIPLTHRHHSQALTLITGHTRSGGQQPAWGELAGKGRTLAVYMGVKQAASLRHSLLDSGLSGDLPVAIVVDGSRDRQQVLHGTIRNLPALASQVLHGAPGLLIIGEVAALGKKLAWFETAPLIRNAA